jgi:hypothetical protein
MRYRILVCMLFVALAAGAVGRAQGVISVALALRPGFDGAYRPDTWLPVHITVANSGDALAGRLIARPETNGRALASAYSTAIDLPAGTTKTAFLYIQARDFSRSITVELVSDEGERYTQASASLSAVGSRDLLIVTLADASAASLVLGDVRPVGQQMFQARWEPASLPDHPAALEAVDVIIVSSLADNALTDAQKGALRAWVYAGGHLIAVGGANWQGTNAAVGDLLPLQPRGVAVLDDLSGLAVFAYERDALSGRAAATVGDVLPGARVLASAGDVPLLVRGVRGDGVVDFLATNPSQAPLAAWNRVGRFWQAVIASVPIANSWQRGFLEKARLADAVAILPDEQLLPPVTSLIAFISVYVLAIGPLNYLVLTRLRRQEWAWITIPACIVIFSALAAGVGFNLRGTEVILSRIRVVRAWPEAGQALEHSVVGLLSPRREVYQLTPEDGRFLGVVPGIGQTTASFQAAVEIAQGSTFTARDFAVEGGIFGNFEGVRTVPSPALRGDFTLITRADGSQTFQGSVRNETEVTLLSPVLLARGASLHLPDLAPGEVYTLAAGDLTLANVEGNALPSAIENNRLLPGANQVVGRGFNPQNQLVSAGLALPFIPEQADSADLRAYLRREAFLHSMMRDQYNSTHVGDALYLIGWTRAIPRDIAVSPGSWRSVDDTLYIVAMAVEAQAAPRTDRLLIPPDRFVWTIEDRILREDAGVMARSGLLDAAVAGIDDILLAENEGFVVRFTPLPGARLAEVARLNFAFTRGSGFANQMEIAFWNWQQAAWEVQAIRLQAYEVENPARFVAPDGSVRVRMISTYPSGTSRLRNIKVSMVGTPTGAD